MARSAATAYRSLKSLTKREAAYLRQLNHQLRQAETWILNSLSQGMAASHWPCRRYVNAVAALDARVYCLLRQDHPHFDPATENIVADLDANFLLARSTLQALQIRWRSQAEHERHFLAATPACLLFQRLAVEACHGNMAPLLSIGTIRVEIALRREKLLQVNN